MSPARSGVAALAAFAPLFALPLHAADEPMTVPPVIVTATRSAQSAVTTPASVTVITREEIVASGATQIAEVLRGQGAIQLSDLYGDGSRVTVGLRGFGVTGGDNTLVLVDGRRLNNTDIAGPDFSSIDLGDVERIEIIQGSAGALYGDQAVGGVINIITRGTDTKRGEVVGTVGADATRTVRALVSERFDSGVGFKLSARLHSSDNYRDHNQIDTHRAALLTDYEHDAGRIFGELRYSDESLELPGDLTAAQIAQDRRQAKNNTDRSDSETVITRIGGRQRLSDNWQIEAELGNRDEAVDGLLEFFGLLNTLSQRRDHLTFTPRLVGTVPLDAGDALVTAGIDWDDVDYRLDSRSTMSTFLQNADQTMWAAYGQAVVPFGERLTGTFGARYAEVDNSFDEFNEFLGFVTTQRYDITDDATAFEAGLAFQATPEVRLFARIDTPFRFAKVDENAYRALGSRPLDTQTGESWEGGAEWSRHGAHAKLLLYRLDLENELGYDPSGADPFGFNSGANVNFDDTRRDGLTIEGAMPAGNQVTFTGQFSYTDATFTSGPYRGNEIPMVAPQTTRIGIDLRPDPAWSLFTEAVYVGKRRLDGDFANTRPRLDEALLLNVNLRYLRGPLSAELRVSNLGDELYNDYGSTSAFGGETFYPAPERRWFLTLGYQLP